MKPWHLIILSVLVIVILSTVLAQLAIAQDNSGAANCLEERAYHLVYIEDIDGDVQSLDDLSCAIILGDFFTGVDYSYIIIGNLPFADLSGMDLNHGLILSPGFLHYFQSSQVPARKNLRCLQGQSELQDFFLLKDILHNKKYPGLHYMLILLFLSFFCSSFFSCCFFFSSGSYNIAVHKQCCLPVR